MGKYFGENVNMSKAYILRGQVSPFGQLDGGANFVGMGFFVGLT